MRHIISLNTAMLGFRIIQLNKHGGTIATKAWSKGLIKAKVPESHCNKSTKMLQIKCDPLLTCRNWILALYLSARMTVGLEEGKCNL